MDFLDPRKRRHHHIRLMIGYVLMAVVLVLTSYLLVNWAYGNAFNTKTGQVVEYGLLFVDSKPGGAAIYLNGRDQHAATSARLNLTAGVYDLTIKKAGYSDWRRQVSLSGHSVSRIIYPLLLPADPKSTAIKSYDASPPMISSSPDHRWLLVQPPTPQGQAGNFDLFDLSKSPVAAQPLSLPPNLLNGADSPESRFGAVEWTADSGQVLLKHVFTGGVEFLLLNRSDPASSFNLNRLFNYNSTEAALINHKSDQFYLYSQPETNLLAANTAKKTTQQLLGQVLAYKALVNNLLLYITDQNAPPGQVLVRIYDAGKTYTLTTLPADSKYLIDATLFQSHWYYGVGSDKTARISLYRDPLDSLKGGSAAGATMALINSGAQNLSISANGRFFASQNAQHLVVYDIENQTRYSYDVKFPLASTMRWLDGHRLMAVSDNQLLIVDFDSQNNRRFIPSASNIVFFDKDGNHLFNLAPISGGGALLQSTDLRAGSDLPKQ